MKEDIIAKAKKAILPASEILASRQDGKPLPTSELRTISDKVKCPENEGSASVIIYDDVKDSEIEGLEKRGWEVTRYLNPRAGFETILSCSGATEGEAAETRKTLMEYQVNYIAYLTQMCKQQHHLSFKYDGTMFPEVLDVMTKKLGWYHAVISEGEEEVANYFTACSHAVKEKVIPPYGGWDW